MNWLSEIPYLKTVLTTRKGGVSKGDYKSNNLAIHVGDDLKSVIINRQRLVGKLGLSYDDLVFMNQVHGNKVLIIDNNSQKIPECDAMITNEFNKALMVMVADCLPILFADVKNRVVGAAHAGWKGTYGRIASNVVEKMVSELGCDKKSIHVWLGPSIRSCCYNVGNDLAEKFNEEFKIDKVVIEKNDTMYLDLISCNKQILTESGIKEENISVSDICVSCNVDKYYSYRAEKGHTGRFAAGIWLKDI